VVPLRRQRGGNPMPTAFPFLLEKAQSSIVQCRSASNLTALSPQREHACGYLVSNLADRRRPLIRFVAGAPYPQRSP